MNKLFSLLLLLPLTAAASGALELDSVAIDIEDKASLQRGARLYADYCQGCHSLKFERYARLARDLGLPEKQVAKEFMLDTGNIGDTMTNAMTAAEGEAWFGVQPPDLSVAVRARSPDWVYSYLRAFYLDPSKPTGVNNLIFKDVAMPNVLGELQGQQKLTTHRVGDHEAQRLDLIQPGRMNAREFDRALTDLVNFMTYVAEPAQLERGQLGKYVLLFVALLTALLYRLKKEYWRDIH